MPVPGTKQVAIYARVSTDQQTVENQALTEVASRHGWEVVSTFADEGVNAAKGRSGRPGFDAFCTGIACCYFNLVMSWSADRAGRSLQNLVSFLGELHRKRIDPKSATPSPFLLNPGFCHRASCSRPAGSNRLERSPRRDEPGTPCRSAPTRSSSAPSGRRSAVCYPPSLSALGLSSGSANQRR